jgi:hypothetical protein
MSGEAEKEAKQTSLGGRAGKAARGGMGGEEQEAAEEGGEGGAAMEEPGRVLSRMDGRTRKRWRRLSLKGTG